MARAKKTDEPNRKIGERIETIEVKMTQLEMEDQRGKVLDYLQEKDELEAAWKAEKESHKAAVSDLDSKIAAARGASRAGRYKREVVIEEWVTKQNEVIRIDKATGLEVGRRNATRDELQETLPLDRPKGHDKTADGPEDDGETKLADELADDQAGEGDGGDFGKDE